MITCPNCKEKYKFEDSDDEEYRLKLTHVNPTCPFGIEIYSYTKEFMKETAVDYIMKKFPWITKSHKYLR